MIATLFGKKRIAEDRIANVFVNAVLELTAEGFPTVADELNESPEFLASPAITEDQDLPFARVVIAGNLIEAQRLLEAGLDKRMFSRSISKFAQALDIPCTDLEIEVRSLQSRMERLNFPSKNTVYAMSKVLFQEYDLFRFQDTYFREQRSPNPIVLKRLNGLMGYFLWSWEEVLEQYRIV